MESKKVFKVYQAFRFFAFVMIFLHHTKMYHTFNFYSSAWAVSFFIMLSGFLNGYKYINRYTNIKFKDIKQLLIKRMKKTYFLHIIMLLFSIPLTSFFYTKQNADLIKWIGKFIINGCLLQSYFNKSEIYFSFNGVAWFLSVMVLLILITIPLLFLINKIINSKKGILKLIFLILITIVIDGIYTILVTKMKLKHEFWLYIFPLARIPEYICGLTIGGIMNKSIKKANKVITIAELTSIVLIIVCIYVEKNCLGKFTFLKWSYMWIIPNLLLLFVFSYEDGYISKIFGNKILVKLGNISMETFLIHQVLINYMNKTISNNIIFCKYTVLGYLFIITIILASFISKIDINFKEGEQK